MQAVLYEDGHHGGFGPLTLLRPQFDLRCGALLLREKLELRRPDWKVALLPRRELRAVVAERYPGRGTDSLDHGACLLLSGRVLPDDALLNATAELAEDTLLTSGGVVVGALLVGGGAERVTAPEGIEWDPELLGISARSELPARVVSRPWDLTRLTAEELARDAPLVGQLGEIHGDAHSSAHLVEVSRIALGEGSAVAAGAVLDATRGPVVVGSDVEIMPNAVVTGPCYVGDGSVVKIGARIYGGTSIGRVSKVGGEICESVIQDYANKQHDGFLGHSYVGSWVNLGAGTDTSDLKNNYGAVRVRIGDDVIDTGSASVGATIGDHTKTAIGTILNTGAVVGVFCNVFGWGFPPKSIPSFSWGGAQGLAEHELGKALETARRVMARRGVELSGAEESLIGRVFRATRGERLALERRVD